MVISSPCWSARTANCGRWRCSHLDAAGLQAAVCAGRASPVHYAGTGRPPARDRVHTAGAASAAGAEGTLTVYRWHGLHDVPASWGSSVVTIGVFDGVHRGHRRIVARAAEIGAELGLPLVVVTFDPHPDEVIRPGSHPPLLCTPRYRAELLGRLGADAVCVLPFSYEFSQLPAEDFVKSVLVDALRAAAVVIGANFRFGHKAAGNVVLLGELGEKYDFTAEGVPLLTDH